MRNLTKKAIRYGLTEPNYKKASLLKRAINVKTFFSLTQKPPKYNYDNTKLQKN